MEATLNEYEEEIRTRPGLLTVLCILSFIGSGFIILSSVWSYATAAATVKMVEASGVRVRAGAVIADSLSKNTHGSKAQVKENFLLSFSKAMTEDNIRKKAIGDILASLATLIGALLMWRLSRTGFYIYIAGIIIGVAVPFFLYGDNLMSIGMSVFAGFFGLVFTALYALNIKSLH